MTSDAETFIESAGPMFPEAIPFIDEVSPLTAALWEELRSRLPDPTEHRVVFISTGRSYGKAWLMRKLEAERDSSS